MAVDLEDLWHQLPPNARQVINILNLIQEQIGYIPPSVISELAEKEGLPKSQIQGLVSFFKSFRTCPPGKHRICVCHGTACYARGAPIIYNRLAAELQLTDGDTSPDGLVTVEQVYCVGACSQAPLVLVDGEVHGRIKSYQIPLMLQELRNKT